MNFLKTHYKIIILLVVIFSVGFFIGRINTTPLGAYQPKSSDFGVYFTTTTDHTLNDGYSGPVRLDQYGQLILAN